jgi:uroporphyrinogen III methyltransferase/synthase
MSALAKNARTGALAKTARTGALAGKRILITRPRAQSGAIIRRLTSLGAVPVLFPTIEIHEPENLAQLDLAINRLSAYGWLIFTSANGVTFFWRRLKALGKNSQALTGIRVAAIGPATASALRRHRVQPAFIPEEFVAEAIVPGLGDVRGQRILLPRADIARPALLLELEKAGAIPEEIAVYRTVPAKPSPKELEELQHGIDVATFTSSSTVRNFMRILDDQAASLLKGAVIACIGPITAETAHSLGLEVHVVATEYTADGLVDAVVEYYTLDSIRKNQ